MRGTLYIREDGKLVRWTDVLVVGFGQRNTGLSFLLHADSYSDKSAELLLRLVDYHVDFSPSGIDINGYEHLNTKISDSCYRLVYCHLLDPNHHADPYRAKSTDGDDKPSRPAKPRPQKKRAKPKRG